MKKSWLIAFGAFSLIFCATSLLNLRASAAGTVRPNEVGWIPAQTFLMGDAVGNGRADAQPVHPVTLSRYWMSPDLVTAAEYCKFLNESDWVKEDGTFIVSGDDANAKGQTPDPLVNLPYAPIEKKDGIYVPKPGMERQPMYYVTWEGAAYYCNWLSTNQGLVPCYRPKQNWACNIFAGGYHLPTEAQWECAARCGNRGQMYPWGNQASPKLANYANHVGHITDVGSYPANRYGIHDLAGNVLEWCQDWYQFNYYSRCTSGIQDPTGPQDLAGDAAPMRALRGGMYYDPLSYQTCSRRYGTSDTKDCFNFSGFRVVRESREVVRDFAGMESSTQGDAIEMREAADWFASHFNGRHVPFSFELNGRSSSELLRHWKISRSEGPVRGGRRRYTITASDPKTGLEIECEATVYADFPAIDWVLHVTNRGSKDSPILENLRVLDGNFEKPKSELREFILRHSRGSRAFASDFSPTDTLLAAGSRHTLGGHGGRPSDYDLPFMNLQWGDQGAVIAIGWTGQWQARFIRDEGCNLRVEAGMQYLRTRLHPGESIRTPRILLCFWHGEDMMRGHNLFRQLILKHYSPRLDGHVIRPPIALSVSGLNHYSEANQLAAIPKLKKLGIEVLWMDAGWFVGGWPNGAGTWAPNPEYFPHGLAPIGKAAHAAGLKFLVWFELERVSRGSRIAREHPEWVIGPITEYGGLFNFGIPEARRWMTDLISEEITRSGIDILRQDMNMEPVGYWLRNDKPDRMGMTEIKFVEGFYRMLDDLRARHPGLWIDDCASGGRNIDLEMMMRSIPLWQSDAQCIPFPGETGQLQNNGLNLYLPMHSGGTGCTDGTLEPSYGFRSVMMEGNPQSIDANTPVEKVEPTIELYHRVRPYFKGDYYPLFAPSPDLHRWFGYQLNRGDLGKGMVLVFRRAKCAQAETTVVLRGIDPNATYRLFDQDSGKTNTISGSDLRMLSIKVDAAPGSRLLFYERE